jgi:multisubunit Na+/H+ antiporter MnhE subunit
MNTSKVAHWVCTALFILFLFWLANLALGLSLGIFHLALGFIVGLFKLVFSKAFFVVAGIALIIYLFSNRRENRHHRNDYLG